MTVRISAVAVAVRVSGDIVCLSVVCVLILVVIVMLAVAAVVAVPAAVCHA